MRTGSTGKTALTYLLAFSLLLGTAAFISFQASATTVTANLEIAPDRVDLQAYPENFKFKLWFSGKYKNYNVTDIDRQSITIDGIPYPIKGKGKGVWKIRDNTVTFKVNGTWLIDYVIWPKIYHMGRLDPNPDRGTKFPYNIDITVTGKFKEDSPFAGTEFTATARIHAYTPRTNPPPPPPPP